MWQSDVGGALPFRKHLTCLGRYCPRQALTFFPAQSLPPISLPFKPSFRLQPIQFSLGISSLKSSSVSNTCADLPQLSLLRPLPKDLPRSAPNIQRWILSKCGFCHMYEDMGTDIEMAGNRQ